MKNFINAHVNFKMKFYAMGVLLADLSDNPRRTIISSRLWGIYERFEDAEQTILFNTDSIFEGYYNIGCIEEYELINFKKETNFEIPKQWWYLSSYDSSQRIATITSLGTTAPKNLINVCNIWVG